MRKYKAPNGDIYYLYADSEVPKEDWVEVEDDDESLVPDFNFVPPVIVPSSITMRQARLILLQYGLLDDIEAIIQTQGRAAQIEWEYAQEVHRTHPLLQLLQSAQGLTNEQIDSMFLEASKI